MKLNTSTAFWNGYISVNPIEPLKFYCPDGHHLVEVPETYDDFMKKDKNEKVKLPCGCICSFSRLSNRIPRPKI